MAHARTPLNPLRHAALLVLAVAGCRAVPVPSERAALVGDWQATEPVAMRLVVTPDGWLWYRKVDGQVTTTVRGPIKEYRDDAVVVGVWFVKTTFDVHRPPFEEGDTWKVVVDSVELVRTSRRAVIPDAEP